MQFDCKNSDLRVEEPVRSLGAVVDEDVAGKVEAQHEQQHAVGAGATLGKEMAGILKIITVQIDQLVSIHSVEVGKKSTYPGKQCIKLNF